MSYENNKLADEDRKPLSPRELANMGDALVKRALSAVGQEKVKIERRSETGRRVTIGGGCVWFEYAEEYFPTARRWYTAGKPTGRVIVKTDASSRWTWRRPPNYPGRTFKPLKATGEVNIAGLGKQLVDVCRENANIEAHERREKRDAKEAERKLQAIRQAHPEHPGVLDTRGSDVRLTVSFDDEDEVIAVLSYIKERRDLAARLRGGDPE